MSWLIYILFNDISFNISAYICILVETTYIKILKHYLKQYATKQPVGSLKKSKRKLKNTWRQTEIETQESQIHGMQQKQF